MAERQALMAICVMAVTGGGTAKSVQIYGRIAVTLIAPELRAESCELRALRAARGGCRRITAALGGWR
jgi:hypothetical protein